MSSRVHDDALATRSAQKVKQFLYERTSRGTLTAYGVSDCLFSGQTRFQQMELWQSVDHGKLLLLDGELQSATKDEFIYHETLVHPALARVDEARTALILGGGEGGTLRELLRAKTLERATMVDIDGEVVELCKKVLPEQSDGAFDDPRTILEIGDARHFMEETDLLYDVIVSDLTEPNIKELSNSLFSVDAFRLIQSRLASGGVFSLQASHGGLGETARHLEIVKNLRTVFKQVRSLLVHIPSFCCHWCFAVATDDAELDLCAETIDRRLAEKEIAGLKFYDSQTDQRLFSLPLYLRQQLQRV